MLKVAKEKWLMMPKSVSIRLMANFLLEIVEARKQWADKVLKEETAKNVVITLNHPPKMKVK